LASKPQFRYPTWSDARLARISVVCEDFFVGSLRKHFYLATDFLFARPSWLSGAGRLFDIWALFDSYNISPTPRLADARATFSDWSMIGEDFCVAMDQFDSQQRELEGHQGRLFPQTTHPA